MSRVILGILGTSRISLMSWFIGNCFVDLRMKPNWLVKSRIMSVTDIKIEILYACNDSYLLLLRRRYIEPSKGMK
jgi:hypothetical protein